MRTITPLRLAKFCVLCITMSLIEVSIASAQQPKNRFGSEFRNRPTVSPYLSIVDSGGAANLFNIVRPRQQAQSRARDFRRELDSVESNFQQTQRSSTQPPEFSAPITTGRMGPTGHSAGFGDLAGYFGNQGGRGSNGASKGNAGTGRAGFGGMGTVGFGGGGSAAYGGGYGGGYGPGIFGGGVYGGNNVFGGGSPFMGGFR
ncbi:hypothetical protein [Schlesneria sp. DSM 10557]|uniref:hypothetical protein n=1 Tax=Schlesneria sp. DSM 10557 TaxID=3044399 RepID=UPI0035A045F6